MHNNEGAAAEIICFSSFSIFRNVIEALHKELKDYEDH